APPHDALASFDPPAPPPSTVLAPLPPERAGLAMLSYTRLAHGLDAAALEPAELAIALDPSEFDVDAQDPGDVPALAADELPGGPDTGIFLHDLFEHVELATLVGAPALDAW